MTSDEPVADPAADPAADAAAELAELEGRPLEEHAAVYQRLHERLQGALSEIDGA